MTRKQDEAREGVDLARRNFLRAGIAGASVAAATTAATVAPAEAAESDSEKKKARYQETAHVKKFYATNRY
jgi:hypothetical protein